MHLSFHCNELTSPHTTTVTRVSLLGHRGLGLTDFGLGFKDLGLGFEDFGW